MRADLSRFEPSHVVLAIAEKLAQSATIDASKESATIEGPVYLAFRHNGELVSSVWTLGCGWRADIGDALDQAFHDDALVDACDTVELCLTHSYRQFSSFRGGAALTNVHRGIKGIELRWQHRRLRVAPTEMLARNLSFKQVINDFIRLHNVPESQRDGPQLLTSTFEAHQFIVTLEGGAEVVPVQRGSVRVPPESVSQSSVMRLRDQMAQWMVHNIHPDGRMTYKYWPSRGEEAVSNNVIRQFMASICLGRLARSTNDVNLAAIAEQNLAYNINQFYVSEGDLGFIEFQSEIKLGAAAMAAMAILESQARARFADVENRLFRFLGYMWQPSGAFLSFFRPIGREYDNQNFYPGESLLAWAALLAEQPCDQLLSQFMRSFEYYRQWHRLRRNPAFVPWHTQAYAAMWRLTRKHELVDFIFEINDWLLGMQQWDGLAYRDLQGRFYDPQHPEYGPPHASSDGAYLEGLVDAFLLAREVSDRERVDRYRRVIVRALRHVMQLQFRDDIDMFYVSKRQRVRGGLRTALYDNTIRIDNVQHNLLAVLKIVDAFGQGEYVDGQGDSPAPGRGLAV